MRMNRFSILRSCAVILAAIVLMFATIVQSSPAQTPAAAGVANTDPKDLAGQWQGTAQFPPPRQALRVVFQVSKADGGGWKTVFNYIDLIAQGQGIPRAATLTLQGVDVAIKVPGNSGSYEGKLSADGNSVTGTWKQGDVEAPLNLTRSTTTTAWEVPKPPPPLKPMAADYDPTFEVATIKPNNSGENGKGFNTRPRSLKTSNTSVTDLIMFAYDVHKKQIINGPEWMDKDRFDLTAQPDGEGEPSDRQWKVMIQKLLADRFQLKFHPDKRELSVYILSVAKGGPKNLNKSDNPVEGFSVPIRGIPGGFTMPIRNAEMKDFASLTGQCWTGQASLAVTTSH